VNVRTSRAPSLSMIRQCRNATSKRSSFFAEKFTLKVGLGLACVILPPLCVRSPGSVYHSHWRSIRCGRRFWAGGHRTAALSFLPGFHPCAPIRERVLTNLPLGSVIALVFCPGSPAVSLRRRPFGFAAVCVTSYLGGQESRICRNRGGAPSCAAGGPLLPASTLACRAYRKLCGQRF
jgi:hypothetical protein